MTKQEEIECFGKTISEMTFRERLAAYDEIAAAEKTSNQIERYVKALRRGDISGVTGFKDNKQVVLAAIDGFCKE
jgi:hypothetical protein